MKFNSKILGVALASLAIAMVISAASAVDLVDEFKNDNFGIEAIPGTNFTESVNIASNDIVLTVLENSGNGSNDINSITYFKDSSANKNQISGFIKDLEKDGNKVEETDKYVVLKNTKASHDVDVGNSLDGIFDFVGSIFSSEGLNFSADGNSVSLSSNGLKVSDADGQNVSITSEGVNVSGNSSSGNESVYVSGDVDTNIGNSDYSIYLKNQGNDKVVVISGNNLELLKAMAETVSFNEN